MSGKIEHVVLKAIGGLIDLILAEFSNDSASFTDNEDARLKEFYCGNHFISPICSFIESNSAIACLNISFLNE